MLKTAVLDNIFVETCDIVVYIKDSLMNIKLNSILLSFDKFNASLLNNFSKRNNRTDLKQHVFIIG